MPIVQASLDAGAWISTGDLLRHSRQDAHFGTETDNDVVLSGPIGPYPEGTLLSTFLSGLSESLASLSSNIFYVSGFTAGAFIQRTSVMVSAEVRLQPPQESTFSAGSVIVGLSSDAFSVSAVIMPDAPGETC